MIFYFSIVGRNSAAAPKFYIMIRSMISLIVCGAVAKGREVLQFGPGFTRSQLKQLLSEARGHAPGDDYVDYVRCLEIGDIHGRDVPGRLCL